MLVKTNLSEALIPITTLNGNKQIYDVNMDQSRGERGNQNMPSLPQVRQLMLFIMSWN